MKKKLEKIRQNLEDIKLFVDLGETEFESEIMERINNSLKIIEEEDVNAFIVWAESFEQIHT